MKRLIIIGIFILSSALAFSQNSLKKNEIFVELGGNGLLGSINYNRQISKKPGLGIRAGVGSYGIGFPTIPVGVNYLIPLIGKHSFLDLGLGATYTKADVQLYVLVKRDPNYVQKYQSVYFVPSLGTRAYTTKNFVWHFNATPVFTQYGLIPWVGFGFGKRF